MKVLVINAGSSSLKYQLLGPETGHLLAKGLCARIGIDGKFTYKPQVEGKAAVSAADVPMPTHSEAIQAGVLQGMLFEIEGYIARLQGRCADLCVIFTGGDAKYFAKRIKNTIFADCNLVFRGLNRILEYNASEEHLD